MEQTPDRVGLYIKPETRNRLNLFKAELSLAKDRVMSQDDAINHLLDLHYAEAAAPRKELLIVTPHDA